MGVLPPNNGGAWANSLVLLLSPHFEHSYSYSFWDEDSFLNFNFFLCFSTQMGICPVLPQHGDKWANFLSWWGLSHIFFNFGFIKLGGLFLSEVKILSFEHSWASPPTPFFPTLEVHGHIPMFYCLEKFCLTLYCFFSCFRSNAAWCVGIGVLFQSPVGGHP